MSQFYAPLWLCPTDSSWQQSFLLCFHLPAFYHQPAGLSAFLGKKLFKTALQGLWKINATQSGEAAVSALLSSSPLNAALQNGVLCIEVFACYKFLAEIFSFLKKNSVISFSITAVCF